MAPPTEPAEHVGAVVHVDRRGRGLAAHRLEGAGRPRDRALRDPGRRRRGDPLELAHQVPRQVDHVAAHPGERAGAGARGGELPRARQSRLVPPVLEEDPAELPDLADAALAEQPGDEPHRGDLAVVEVDGVDDTGRRRGPVHALALGGGRGQRLLAEYVLARPGGRDRHRGVEEVGRDDADEVHVRARHDLFPVGGPRLEAQPRGRRLREGLIDVGQLDEAHLGDLGTAVGPRAGVRDGVRARDASCADQADANGRVPRHADSSGVARVSRMGIPSSWIDSIPSPGGREATRLRIHGGRNRPYPDTARQEPMAQRLAEARIDLRSLAVRRGP